MIEIDRYLVNGVCPECYSGLDVDGFCINVDCEFYTTKPVIIDLPAEVPGLTE